MKMIHKRIILGVFIVLPLLLGNCQRNTNSEIGVSTNTPGVGAESTSSSGISTALITEDESSILLDTPVFSETETNREDSEPTEQPTPVFTPTPDLRLPPEQWQEWPVIPVISPNAVSIYKKGIESGNNPHNFSKIGDCQSIKEVLLGIYDLPTRYTLSSENQYLQETIDHYSGSFNRDGMAVRGGFNAATVLSPIWADPEYCEPGETPIQCEFRVHKPTMVIISLEVWWDGRSPERYEQYMRRIIEYSINQGVVPILSTKADNVEGDHSINYTTAKLAYEYDVPLWNFWLAVQDLPYQGIDPEMDGFHISVAAWNIRSFTALQTIHALHQAVITSGDYQGAIPVEDSEDQGGLELSSLNFSQKLESIPQMLPGILYFELSETIDGSVLPAGIYSLDFHQGQLTQMFPPGTHIVSNVVENNFIVKSDTDFVYVRNTGEVQPLSGFDFNTSEIHLLGGDQLLLLVQHEGEQMKHYLGEIDLSGNVTVTPLTIPKLSSPVNPILAVTSKYLVAGDNDCLSEECLYTVIIDYLDPEKADVIEMIPFEAPSLHPASGQMAFWREINGTDSLHFIDLANRGREQYIGLFGNVFLDQAWQHQGNTLAVIKMERSAYYGRATDILHYFVDADTNVVREVSALSGLNPLISWSPDDNYLVTSLTQLDSTGDSTIVLRFIDPVTGETIFLDSELGMTSSTYIAITKLIWSSSEKEQ